MRILLPRRNGRDSIAYVYPDVMRNTGRRNDAMAPESPVVVPSGPLHELE
jgi:hypothetical protein